MPPVIPAPERVFVAPERGYFPAIPSRDDEAARRHHARPWRGTPDETSTSSSAISASSGTQLARKRRTAESNTGWLLDLFAPRVSLIDRPNFHIQLATTVQAPCRDAVSGAYPPRRQPAACLLQVRDEVCCGMVH